MKPYAKDFYESTGRKEIMTNQTSLIEILRTVFDAGKVDPSFTNRSNHVKGAKFEIDKAISEARAEVATEFVLNPDKARKKWLKVMDAGIAQLKEAENE